ncbi:uncharacterized protein N7496_012609 [Penicillium cataractarum]|uniref:Vacuolar protein sorting protein 62 n=1 Tax=Penicillium cataractarum TaxID=2100454 RepID=A0A9W9R7Y8_9EURO|nr:uncharacterized protein N7496_012609 [Penicillium cataractarum]KAJ5355397.1 hypothetical protein N7496_012609 [Penicillium cataractarum]
MARPSWIVSPLPYLLLRLLLLCSLLSLVASRPTIDHRDPFSTACSPTTAVPLAHHCIDSDPHDHSASSGSLATAALAVYEQQQPAPADHSASSTLAVAAESLQQMTRKVKAAIATLTSLILYVSINSLARTLRPNAWVWYEEDKEEPSWLATSGSWFDRKACRWLGVCGATHFRMISRHYGHRDPTRWSELNDENLAKKPWRTWWTSGADKDNQSEWDADERARREIPDYVFDYAPLVHLYSGEQFWPGDIAEHLYHTTPMLNYTPIQAQWDHPTLEDLNGLNQWEGGRHVFLTSDDDPTTRPPWLEGEQNIPRIPGNDEDEDGNGNGNALDESWADWDGRVDGEILDESDDDRAEWDDLRRYTEEGRDRIEQEQLARESEEAHRRFKQELRKRYGGHPPVQEPLQGSRNQGAGGRSDAPAVLLVMDKGNGIVDAFWFYFYSFNLGNTVVNVRFGNHVGDWEHCLMRFHNGQPKALFFSAHTAGEAYRYEAVEKIGRRPVIYSAEGSHAMYAHAGVHEYILPWGLLHDITDRGPLWDPVLNAKGYTYDYDTDDLRSSTFTPDAPTEWFYFRGHWGDKFYPLGDSRQYRFAGQYHYVNGPIGPRFKHLNRRKVCQGPDREACVIRDYIGEAKRAPRWAEVGVGE